MTEKLPQLVLEALEEKTGSGVVPVWTQLAGGGSSRLFFRLKFGNESFILIHYQLPPLENRLYGTLNRALAARGLPVPGFLWEDMERRCLALEDVGSCDLFHRRDRDGQELYALYLRIMEHVADWHDLPENFDAQAGCETLPAFDHALYAFEHQYFAGHCIEELFPARRADWQTAEIQSDLAGLSEKMLAAPATWIHRDFQSRNIMLRGDSDAPVIIDFQGMRRGNPAYDLASLLFDPYVSIADDLREACLIRYVERRGGTLTQWREAVEWAGVQRLLQALGAYAKLARIEGKQEFLNYVPVALQRLRTLSHRRELRSLASFLDYM